MGAVTSDCREICVPARRTPWNPCLFGYLAFDVRRWYEGDESQLLFLPVRDFTLVHVRGDGKGTRTFIFGDILTIKPVDTAVHRNSMQ
jgi:hypothetical protein